MQIPNETPLNLITLATEAACAELGITEAEGDLSRRSEVVIFISDLILTGETDPTVLRKRVITRFR